MSVIVKLLESSIFIPNDKQQAAWEAIAALDDPFRTWWNLEAGWSRKHKTVEAVLDQVGVSSLDNTMGLILVSYDGPIGDEDELLPVLASFSAPGTYLQWHFENGEIVRQTVTEDGTLELTEATLSWESRGPINKDEFSGASEMLTDVVRQFSNRAD